MVNEGGKSGSEVVRGGIVLAFFFSGLESWGPCDIRCFLSLSLLSGIDLNLSP